MASTNCLARSSLLALFARTPQVANKMTQATRNCCWQRSPRPVWQTRAYSKRGMLCVASGLSRDEIRNLQKSSRIQQEDASKLLMLLLQAGDPEAVAQEHLESLTEGFFTTASTYLQLAKQEGEEQIVQQVERVLQVTMDVKNKTLRPEIQLLNRLLSTPRNEDRQRILGEGQAIEVLELSDRYFFTLVEHVTKDMTMQPDSSHKTKVLQQLQSIKEEAEAVLKKNAA